MSDSKPPYKYSLSSIDLFEMQIHAPSAPFDATSELNFNVNIENAIQPENGWLLSKVTVGITKQKGAEPVGQLAAMLAFAIADFKTVVTKNKEGIAVVPPELLATLNGIAISTTRGVMFGVFKGTPLHGALLPLMDVKAFAPELPLEGK